MFPQAQFRLVLTRVQVILLPERPHLYASIATFLSFLAAYTLSQFYRSFLAVIAPELAFELNLSATDLGAASAAWFMAFAAAQFPLGAALDRRGPRRTVPIFMIVGIVGCLLFSKAQSSRDIILAMGFIGVGCAPALMGAMFVFGRSYPSHRFAFLSSMMIGLGSFGNLLGTTPLALAVGAYGWRSVLLGLSSLTAVSALCVWKMVSDPPVVAHHEGKRQDWTDSLREVLHIKALWPVWPLIAVGYAILIAERSIWVGPFFSEVYGLDVVSRGNHIFLMAASIALGAFAYGPLDQWFKTYKWMAFTGSLITRLSFFALSVAIAPDVWASTILLSVIGSVGMTYAVVVAHIRSFLPEHILGRGLTFANFLCMASAGVIQIFSGIYVDHLKADALPAVEVYSRLHAIFGAILFIATAIYFFSTDRRNGPHTQERQD